MNNFRSTNLSSTTSNTTESNEEDQLNRINLQALQNRDPYITKIVDQAQRVCVFKFSAEKRQWVKKKKDKAEGKKRKEKTFLFPHV